MANILGLKGFNKAGSSTNKLLAAYENDVIDVSTGLGAGLNLNGNNVEFETFLDTVFLQNYNTRPLTYDGSVWSKKYVGRSMISKYIKKFKTQLYLANCLFSSPQTPLDTSSAALSFPSRVFYSDFFVGNNLTWGLEWGTNGKTYLDSPIFELAQPIVQDFKFSNIKVGDPIFFTNDSTLATKPYFVSSIPSPLRLILTENLPKTATGVNFWVGRNWFDVGTDDNDSLTGIGERADTILFFKLMTLWYYNGQLRKVADAVGTSSNRSIVTYRGYTYYFHGSQSSITGIYRFDGANSIKISRGIDPFLQGMSTGEYTGVVGWREGDEIRFYLGDVANSNYGISMINAVATYHTVTQCWDVGPINDVIVAETTFRTGNREDVFVGTDSDKVLQMGDGYKFNTAPIPFRLRTGPKYPLGTEVINEFKRIQVIGRDVTGIKVKYKLWDNPQDVDDQYYPLGDLTHDKTEIEIPYNHNNASGIDLMFESNDSLENDFLIEKVTTFYKPDTIRMK